MLDDEYNDFEEMNDSKDITIPPLKKINHEKKEKKNKNKKISIEDIDGKKIKKLQNQSADAITGLIVYHNGYRDAVAVVKDSMNQQNCWIDIQ